MGTGRVPLKVNSKGKKNLECMEEMHAFMQCFAVSTSADVADHPAVTPTADSVRFRLHTDTGRVSAAVGHRWRCKVCQFEDSTR